MYIHVHVHISLCCNTCLCAVCLQESFALDKYIEKLSQNDPATGIGPLGKSKVKPFDPKALLHTFQHSIHVLGELAERNQRRVEKLEHVCVKQENEHNGRIAELEGTYQVGFYVCVVCVCVCVCM